MLKLPVEFDILHNNVILYRESVQLEGNQQVSTRVSFPLPPDSCKIGIHARRLMFRFTTDYDDEKAIRDSGLRMVNDFAAHLIESVETFVEDHLIDRLFAFDLLVALTDDEKRKSSADYQYKPDEVPRRLKDHRVSVIDGIERLVPIDPQKRKALLKEAKTTGIDIEKFWDDYTWSELRKESSQLFKEIGAETSSTLNHPAIHKYKIFNCGFPERPADGKITRNLVYWNRFCRFCYATDDVPFVYREEEDYTCKDLVDDKEIQTPKTPKTISFHVNFRPLSDLTFRAI